MKKKKRIRKEFPTTTFQRNIHGGYTEIPWGKLTIVGTVNDNNCPYITIERRLGQMDLQISNPRTMESLAKNILKALEK